LQLSQEGGEHPAALLRIWQLASFFYENPRYGDVFDQIYVGSDGKLYAVPKLSSLYIVVGDAEELQTKFENLWAFFDQGINQVGWDTYSAISLEYEGQVVCTRAEAQ
jgi:cell division protein FtsQ